MQKPKVKVGDRFGKLEVLEHYVKKKGRTHSQTYCKVRCDCGTVKEVSAGAMRHRGTRSCGCLNKVRGPKNRYWQGHGNISQSFWHRIEAHAKRRKIPFDITIEEAWDVYRKQQGRCALTNEVIGFEGSIRSFIEKTASLDRIDSTKGYTRSNIQWTHKKINMMKHTMSIPEFYEWCRKVTNHLKPGE